MPSGGKVAKLLSGDGTGSVAGSGNLANGTETDLVAAYNAANSKKIKTTVNWTPTLTAGLETSAKNLPAELAPAVYVGGVSPARRRSAPCTPPGPRRSAWRRGPGGP